MDIKMRIGTSKLAGEYGIKMTNEVEKLLESKDPDALTALRLYGFRYYYNKYIIDNNLDEFELL